LLHDHLDGLLVLKGSVEVHFCPEMMNMHIRPFTQDDEDSVVHLWTECGLVVPWNDPHHDIQRKLKVQADMFLVACVEGQVIATVMAGYDGHRGWINYLAVHPQYQRVGIAKRLMKEAESRLRAKGCPKINLQVRSSNAGVIEFYKKVGFTTDDVVSLGKRLEPDE
jgi:ribosomal protein S18 acetylase RimI-like enzyme